MSWGLRWMTRSNVMMKAAPAWMASFQAVRRFLAEKSALGRGSRRISQIAASRSMMAACKAVWPEASSMLASALLRIKRPIIFLIPLSTA